MAAIVYPSRERIIELNLLVLSMMPAKKGDRPQVLNLARLSQALDDCEEREGDVYD